MIRADDLTLMLGGKPVVNAVRGEFARGRVTAILGPNGAGKTSLLKALAGLITPAKGSVVLGDQPLASIDRAERARRLGYLPQNAEPAWAITVRELVALGRLPHHSRFAAPSPVDDAAIDTALTVTDTTHLATRTIDTLSGGERARAQIARVLATEPDWILADEPLGHLDPPHQRDVLNLFRTAASAGRGVITILHQIDAAARVADDVLLLRDGRLVAHGPVATTLTPETLEATFGMPFRRISSDGLSALVPA